MNSRFVHFDCPVHALDPTGEFPLFGEAYSQVMPAKTLFCVSCRIQIDPSLRVPTYPGGDDGIYYSVKDNAGHYVEIGRLP